MHKGRGLNGFGVARLGLLALRFPSIASLVLVAATLLAAAGLPKLGYSGANIDILRDGSQEIADYDLLLSAFRNFNNDAVVLIRTPDTRPAVSRSTPDFPRNSSRAHPSR